MCFNFPQKIFHCSFFVKRINFTDAKTSIRVSRVKSLLIFILPFIFLHTHAQLTGTRLIRDIQYSPAPGNINIVQSRDIIKLIDKHLYEESKNKGITGYRIRIYANSGKQAYNEGPKVQAEFAARYSSVKTYYIFDSPFYLLYVGDFRTHSEAMKFLKQIERVYPDAFIVRSKINYPPI